MAGEAKKRARTASLDTERNSGCRTCPACFALVAPVAYGWHKSRCSAFHSQPKPVSAAELGSIMPTNSQHFENSKPNVRSPDTSFRLASQVETQESYQENVNLQPQRTSKDEFPAYIKDSYICKVRQLELQVLELQRELAAAKEAERRASRSSNSSSVMVDSQRLDHIVYNACREPCVIGDHKAMHDLLLKRDFNGGGVTDMVCTLEVGPNTTMLEGLNPCVAHHHVKSASLSDIKIANEAVTGNVSVSKDSGNSRLHAIDVALDKNVSLSRTDDESVLKKDTGNIGVESFLNETKSHKTLSASAELDKFGSEDGNQKICKPGVFGLINSDIERPICSKGSLPKMAADDSQESVRPDHQAASLEEQLSVAMTRLTNQQSGASKVEISHDFVNSRPGQLWKESPEEFTTVAGLQNWQKKVQNDVVEKPKHGTIAHIENQCHEKLHPDAYSLSNDIGLSMFPGRVIGARVPYIVLNESESDREQKSNSNLTGQHLNVSHEKGHPLSTEPERSQQHHAFHSSDYESENGHTECQTQSESEFGFIRQTLERSTSRVRGNVVMSESEGEKASMGNVSPLHAQLEIENMTPRRAEERMINGVESSDHEVEEEDVCSSIKKCSGVRRSKRLKAHRCMLKNGDVGVENPEVTHSDIKASLRDHRSKKLRDCRPQWQSIDDENTFIDIDISSSIRRSRNLKACSSKDAKERANNHTNLAKACSSSSSGSTSSENVTRKITSKTRRQLFVEIESRTWLKRGHTSEEDESDEDSETSEGSSLGGFIVDESSETSECLEEEDSISGCNSGKSGSEQTISSDNESFSSQDYPNLKNIMKIRRENYAWDFEGDMLAMMEKDPVLCLKAVCALYRQQTEDEQVAKGCKHANKRGFDTFHAAKGSHIAEFLMDKDPMGPMKKSLGDLQKFDSTAADFCKKMAFKHSKQLFEIYKKKEDPHFPYG